MKKLAGGVALVMAIPAILLAAAVGSVSGGGGAAQGALCGGDGPTPAVQRFREEAFARFGDLQSLGVCNVRYIRGPYAESGSTTWSQHAYCNAEDYTRPGAPGTLEPFIDWIEANRERLSVNHLITYPAGSGLEHVVHVDFHPAGTGDPRTQGSRPCEAGELEAAVLSNPRLSFLPEAAADVTEGRVDDRVLQLLLVLSEEHRLGPIGPFITGHSYYVAGTQTPSNHAFGRAVDIAAVDGQPVSASNRAAREVVDAVLLMTGPMLPDEVGSPWEIPHPVADTFTDSAHQGHIHLGWDR